MRIDCLIVELLETTAVHIDCLIVELLETTAVHIDCLIVEVLENTAVHIDCLTARVTDAFSFCEKRVWVMRYVHTDLYVINIVLFSTICFETCVEVEILVVIHIYTFIH